MSFGNKRTITYAYVQALTDAHRHEVFAVSPNVLQKAGFVCKLKLGHGSCMVVHLMGHCWLSQKRKR